VYASADYWDKFCKALYYGTNTTNGVGLTPGTKAVVAVTGNEPWNPAAGTYGKMKDTALANGRATQTQYNNGGGYDAVMIEIAYCATINGARVAASIPELISSTSSPDAMCIREINLQTNDAMTRAVGVNNNAQNYDAFAYAPYPGDGINRNPTNSADVPTLLTRLELAIDSFCGVTLPAARLEVKKLNKIFMMYEGGLSFLSSSQFPLSQATTDEFLTHPDMLRLMIKFMDWMQQVGGLAAMFTASGVPGPIGGGGSGAGFGWQRYQGDDNYPRWVALMQRITTLGTG
jgi:hypothetical protein